MKPPSPLAIAVLLLALSATWTTATAAQHQNRLLHRSKAASPKGGLSDLLHETVDAIKKGAQEIFSHPGPKGGAGMDRFVVLHADSTGPDALNVLVDAGAKQGLDTKAWLYSDVQRWNPDHVEHLWSFACGRTQGRWPMCGTEGLGPDPFDSASVHEHEQQVKLLHGFDRARKHQHRVGGKNNKKRGKGSGGGGPQPPRAVGFGLDINVLLGNSEVVRPALAASESKIVVVLPGSLTRAALRDAAYGALSPLTKAVPGRIAGVARALFSPDLPPRAKGRHLNLVCGKGTPPDNMVRALRRQESERDALKRAAKDLREAGLSVMEIDLDTILDRPAQALAAFYDFLLPDQPRADGEKVSKPVRQLMNDLEVTPRILEDCADALESARIRLAVDDGSDSASLIADVDGVLSQIEQGRKKQQSKQSKKAKRA